MRRRRRARAATSSSVRAASDGHRAAVVVAQQELAQRLAEEGGPPHVARAGRGLLVEQVVVRQPGDELLRASTSSSTPWSMSRVLTNARTTARSPGASFDCVAIVDTSSIASIDDVRSLYTTKRCLLVTRNRYNEFSGYELAGDTDADEQRKRVHIMYDFVALDLVRQQQGAGGSRRRSAPGWCVRRGRASGAVTRRREGEDDDAGRTDDAWRRVGDAARTLGDALATPRGAAPDRAVRQRGDAARALLTRRRRRAGYGDEDARSRTGRLPFGRPPFRVRNAVSRRRRYNPPAAHSCPHRLAA